MFVVRCTDKIRSSRDLHSATASKLSANGFFRQNTSHRATIKNVGQTGRKAEASQGPSLRQLIVLPSPSRSQAPKKEKKEVDEDEAAFKEKKKAEADALKAAREKGTSILLMPWEAVDCADGVSSTQG